MVKLKFVFFLEERDVKNFEILYTQADKYLRKQNNYRKISLLSWYFLNEHLNSKVIGSMKKFCV